MEKSWPKQIRNLHSIVRAGQEVFCVSNISENEMKGLVFTLEYFFN